MTQSILVIRDALRTDMVSDLLQAQKAILLDQRGEALMAQVQLVGVDAKDAARTLRAAADALEA